MEELPSLESETRQRSPSLPLSPYSSKALWVQTHGLYTVPTCTRNNIVAVVAEQFFLAFQIQLKWSCSCFLATQNCPKWVCAGWTQRRLGTEHHNIRIFGRHG